VTRPAQDVLELMRRALLVLAAAGTGAVGFELAAGRHWTQPQQLIAWGAVLLMAAAVGAAAAEPRHGMRDAARILAVTVVLVAGIGIVVHVAANRDVGPLDAVHGAGWAGLARPVQWWLAATMTVGPAPPLAPGLLGMQGCLVLLATVANPGRRR
jgi:hypothetical protein